MNREIRTAVDLGLEIELLPPTTLGELRQGMLFYRPRPDDPGRLDLFVVWAMLETSAVVRSLSSLRTDLLGEILPRQTPVVPFRIIQRR